MLSFSKTVGWGLALGLAGMVLYACARETGPFYSATDFAAITSPGHGTAASKRGAARLAEKKARD